MADSMELKGQYWTDEESDGDNESEQFLYGIQGSCAADLYRHPQLDADIEAVKDIYTESAISVREYGTIDDVDIDLQINVSFLDEEVATAWKVIRTEPIILRLRFSLSQYLDGPEPSVEVFQPSNKDGFSLGLQLKKILTTFTSQQWKHLSNEFLKAQQEKRHSWFKAGGTIKKFRAGLSIFSPIPKYATASTLLQWIISSNRSHIVKLPLSRQLKFMHTSHQFLLLSSPPAKEARFRTAKKLYGSTFAFHGSHIENWHSVLRNGLVNASYTKLQLHGAAYGKGIYLSPISSISFGYSGMGKGQHRMPTKDELVQRYNRMNTIPQSRCIQSRFLQSRNLNCIALCEVITSKDLQKHGNIWVCPVSDHVCTRFFFVYEDGQVGDANINTQEPKVQKEIMRVIGTQIYSS
ncbi:protein mono-ADP-ribosyltransferase PARP6 [Clupea harengus]|uniref:Poly [ADP-ribose] polymerase n=1 Tax=Clupea harengus TaxID=7950 RepID=A0A6P8FI99_CLUHA|nr:protein mono-ADP-ribosyltransferase PARP6 [Clupea harengus]